jgi:dTDP-4-amino-4,6-dideoxygalactose transaminase
MSRIYLSPPDVGIEERRRLVEAFDSNWIAPCGPHVDAFERELADVVGVRHAVALSSGTAALHLALHVLGVKEGDEVITSTLTFAATANAITYVRARPVFLDVRRDTWQMNPDLLEEELFERRRIGRVPAAVISVDLYGQCTDYDRVAALCERHDVRLLEDAAEALGATYRTRNAGTFGRCAAFSFNGNKIITTSGGGMLVSDDSTLVERARHLASQAREPAPHYEHAELGFNFRLSNLLAALGRAQLASLPSKLIRRRRIRDRYREHLGSVPGIDLMPEADYGRSNCWLTCVTIEPVLFGATREDVWLHLESLDIEARPVWKPMHLQPVFRHCRSKGGAISAALFEKGLCLPSGSSLTGTDQDRVIDAILETPAIVRRKGTLVARA